MARKRPLKVAISGVGVAGPTLAYWLKRGGHAPTLIESATAFRTAGYMIDFWGVGYDVAERMGVLPAIRSSGYDLQEVRYVDGRGRCDGRITARTMRRELGDRFTSLPRGDLAAVLYAALEDEAPTRFGTSIVRMAEGDDRIRVAFSDGTADTFDLVVAADGLHSKVRRLTFGPDQPFEHHIGYYVAAFESAGYRPRDELAYVSYSYPGHQMSRFAERGDRSMFLFVFAAEHLGGEEPTDLETRKAALLRVFADAEWEWPAIKAALVAADDIYFDRVSQVSMLKWSKGRVALLGDAAACVSLVAGEGAGLAMTEAYVLAGELCAAADHVEAFAAYEKRLRAFVDAKQNSARSFASAFTPRTALGLWLRNQATKLMAIPGVPGVLVGAQMKDDFVLPDYDLSP